MEIQGFQRRRRKKSSIGSDAKPWLSQPQQKARLERYAAMLGEPRVLRKKNHDHIISAIAVQTAQSECRQSTAFSSTSPSLGLGHDKAGMRGTQNVAPLCRFNSSGVPCVSLQARRSHGRKYE